MTFLADRFRELANDPSWPPPKNRLELGMKYPELRDIYCGKFNMARLALMVVERQQIIWDYRDRDGKVSAHEGMDHQTVMLDFALKEYNINPDHYAKVKQRVDEAEK